MPQGKPRRTPSVPACLARLGRIGDCEIALDDALTAARRAREHRRVNAVLAGAPLAALWGPNPVPRAGGRCLDVVRLLRITTDSPAVEATSTRCQAVLEAFRGRAAAARRMIDSARRTVTELGLRHALLEVEQFAGIVELVVDDPAAAEPHLRQAYNGFRRMGLDADTAETAALLGRACLALDRDAEADELCTESERLAGHALKASIAWRTLRAQLLSRSGDHDEARRVAEAAVSLAERTDALVDHGDACLALATVLGAAGDAAGARAAAERAVEPVRAERCCGTCGEGARHSRRARPPDCPGSARSAEPSSWTTRAYERSSRLDAAVDREAWDEVEQLFAPDVSVESRRKIVGFTRIDLPSGEWPQRDKASIARWARCGTVTRLSPCEASAWLSPDWSGHCRHEPWGAAGRDAPAIRPRRGGSNRAAGVVRHRRHGRRDRRTRRRARPVRGRGTPSGARLENAASQVDRAPFGALRGPRLGCARRTLSPTTFAATIAGGW